ncbi:hypothetical protein [Mycobacterium sp. 852002-51163_SCH5372311]|uniref:hypothetical protein n=1 Tax=Mycobacterium sp. 852002-51163_SCH5372311 TaxID=1834097 RepID=UPI000A98A579|nr:hypothetical protein [Mycobacterium sp. 852002-51163_SCH5372311]
MTNVDPPNDIEAETGQPAAENSGDDHSVVAPPAYPAYSTPPPKGLHTAEDG